MYKYVNGVMYEMTPEEEKAFMESFPPPPDDPPDTLPTPDEQGMIFLRSMAATATMLTDAVALSTPDIIAPWVIGETVTEGNVRRYSEKTYRCRQNHTTQADWTPDITPALWVVIELVATGTENDPITASRGMEYEYGRYYKDPEDNKLYLCKRDNEPDGGKIILHYLPHELVLHYFVLVTD